MVFYDLLRFLFFFLHNWKSGNKADPFWNDRKPKKGQAPVALLTHGCWRPKPPQFQRFYQAFPFKKAVNAKNVYIHDNWEGGIASSYRLKFKCKLFIILSFFFF